MSALVEIRNKKNMTQEDVAKYCGVSNVAYHMYETGKRKIPSDVADKIADVLEISETEKHKIFLPSTFAICK